MKREEPSTSRPKGVMVVRARDEELREALGALRERGSGVIAQRRVMGQLVRDADTGAETLVVGCGGTNAPQQRTVRRWIVAAGWDPDEYPANGWHYAGSTVRVTKPPTGGEGPGDGE